MILQTFTNTINQLKMAITSRSPQPVPTNLLPSTTDIYMHKFNTFGHEI